MKNEKPNVIHNAGQIIMHNPIFTITHTKELIEPIQPEPVKPKPKKVKKSGKK